MKTVELQHAWTWTCPVCETLNIEADVVVEFSEEERAEMIAIHPGESFQTGDLFCLPEELTCRKCGAEFQSEPTIPIEG